MNKYILLSKVYKILKSLLIKVDNELKKTDSKLGRNYNTDKGTGRYYPKYFK